MKSKSKRPSWVIKEDKEAKAIFEAIDDGKIKPLKNAKYFIAALEAAANNTMKKDGRMNIRLPLIDIALLKAKALKEGIPYQTLAASILHKYATDQIG